MPALSPDPPMIAVLPSAESATEVPCLAAPTAPEPTSFDPNCVQLLPLRFQIQVAPRLLPSLGAPTRTVLTSPRATACPWPSSPPSASPPEPTSLPPCCVHDTPCPDQVQNAPLPGMV